MNLYNIYRPLLFLLPAETAHHLALGVLKTGLLPLGSAGKNYPELEQQIAGIRFPNPLGLAAGFDKNAEALPALHRAGFGFVEAGTVTPLPQPGNPKPRLFRLEEDRAVINRLGFNNKGIKAFVGNIRRLRQAHPHITVGANIGKNKDTEKMADDYIKCLHEVYNLTHYITINISSPNTPGLRSIQKAEILGDFLTSIQKETERYGQRTPLFLKISPDVSEEELTDICRLALELKLDALIISNTTISRPETLSSPLKAETGGLSGKPLKPLAHSTLRQAYQLTGGRIPLIGVGGISSAEDAYARIRAGASLVQLYSALVYEGLGLVPEILEGLSALLRKDGFSHISEAVGKG